MKLIDRIRTSQVLAGARDLIARRWIKGHFYSGNDGTPQNYNKKDWLGIPEFGDDDWGYCGDGALRRAAKNALQNSQEWENLRRSQVETVLHNAQKALQRPIKRRIGHVLIDCTRSQEAVWCFNDMPETTKEDILAVFDEAIEDQCKIISTARQDEPAQGQKSQEHERQPG